MELGKKNSAQAVQREDLHAQAERAAYTGHGQEVRTRFEEALGLARQRGDLEAEALELQSLGWFLGLHGEPELGRALLQQSLALREQLQGYEIGQCHRYLAWVEEHLGQRAEAVAHYREALAQFEQVQAPEADVMRAELLLLGEPVFGHPSGSNAGSSYDQVPAERLALLFSEAEGLLRQREPARALERLESEVALEELGGSQRVRWYLLSGWARLQSQHSSEASTLLERGLLLAESQHTQAPLAQKGAIIELAERMRYFLGLAHYEQNLPELALEHHRRCLVAVNDGLVTDPELKLRIYLALGHDYLVLNRHHDAMALYEHAVQQASDAESLASEGSIYWHLGLAYKDNGDLSRAKANLNKALVVFEQQEHIRLAAQLRSLFGQVLINLKRFDEAEANLQQSLGTAQRIGDVSTQGSALAHFAAMHTARGDHDKAIEVAHEGLEVVKESRDQRTEGHLHLTLAMAHEAREDYKASEQELGQAITIFEQMGDQELIGRAHACYGKFLADRGRFQEAYDQMRVSQAAITDKTQDF